MKYIIILGDGMADEPIESLGGKTPLMVADTPHIDKLCREGCCGELTTIPSDMPPASDVANMGVLGYDVRQVYQGRGVLEAASMGVELHDGDLGMRCNLICIENGKIKNHSAGHISNEEAEVLIADLNTELGDELLNFHPGVSYRHLAVLKGGNKQIQCTPPHDVPGTEFKSVLVKAKSPEGEETAKKLNELILASQEILKNHPVNKKRVAEGKDPANSIWLWSAGYKPQMKTFKELYNIESGAVIAAVDLIQGIGKYAGFEIIKVDGATGLHDTNYEGKAEAALEALKKVDFVYLHIEASDEAGHEGNVELKTRTIEYLDKRVVKYILQHIGEVSDDVAIAILPDHPTPCRIKTHTHSPVPFIIYKPGQEADNVVEYNEFAVKEGKFGHIVGPEFMQTFL